VIKHLFIIGAQRSGTTYLYKVLDAHPEVYMAKPVKPEPKYFMRKENFEKGYSAYFNKYFSGISEVVWKGEKSTSYLESDLAALSIKRVVQDATIIVILRNPVERAISHYCFTRDNKLEPHDIERAIQEEPKRKDNWQATVKTSVSPFAYTERGKYIQDLDRWDHFFRKNKLIFLIAEQFIGNQLAISALYQRLGINPKFVPSSLNERVNASSAERSKCVLSSNFSSYLYEIYRPFNCALEERYGLDLSCWEKKP